MYTYACICVYVLIVLNSTYTVHQREIQNILETRRDNTDDELNCRRGAFSFYMSTIRYCLYYSKLRDIRVALEERRRHTEHNPWRLGLDLTDS
jgi:transcription initiation factor IIE alpha subunit